MNFSQLNFDILNEISNYLTLRDICAMRSVNKKLSRTLFSATLKKTILNETSILIDKSFILNANGKVYCWGKDDFYTGARCKDTWDAPTLLPDLPPVKEFKEIDHCVFFLTKNNQVWVWGKNSNKELGLGHANVTIQPTLLSNLVDIKQVELVSWGAFCLTYKGAVWAWKFDSAMSNFLKDHLATIPTLMTNIPKIEKIITNAESNVFFHTNTADIFAMGWNSWGSLGVDHCAEVCEPKGITILHYVTALFAYGSHTICTTADGNTWVWGLNGRGQLGLGDHKDRIIPTINFALANSRKLLVKNDDGDFPFYVHMNKQNEVSLWGSNSGFNLGLGQNHTIGYTLSPIENPYLSHLKEFYQCEKNYYFLNIQGQVWVWGKNNHAGLGLGDKTPRLVPTLITNLNGINKVFVESWVNVALTNNGDVWIWGRFEPELLNLDKDTDLTIPTLIPCLKNVINVFLNYLYIFFITADLTLWKVDRKYFKQKPLHEISFPAKDRLKKLKDALNQQFILTPTFFYKKTEDNTQTSEMLNSYRDMTSNGTTRYSQQFS